MSYTNLNDSSYVVANYAQFVEAAKDVSDDRYYTYEYGDAPYFIVNGENVYEDNLNLPQFPFVVVFRAQPEQGPNVRPCVEILHTINTQKAFQLFNLLLQAGGNMGDLSS